MGSLQFNSLQRNGPLVYSSVKIENQYELCFPSKKVLLFVFLNFFDLIVHCFIDPVVVAEIESTQHFCTSFLLMLLLVLGLSLAVNSMDFTKNLSMS